MTKGISKTLVHKLKRKMQSEHRKFRTVADWINASAEFGKEIKYYTLCTAYKNWASFKSAAKIYTKNELGRKKNKIKAKDESST